MAKKVGGKTKAKSAVRKRKLTQRQLNDSLSETISFVIKGKLTPIKPTVVKKKTQFKRPNRRMRPSEVQPQTAISETRTRKSSKTKIVAKDEKKKAETIESDPPKPTANKDNKEVSPKEEKSKKKQPAKKVAAAPNKKKEIPNKTARKTRSSKINTPNKPKQQQSPRRQQSPVKQEIPTLEKKDNNPSPPAEIKQENPKTKDTTIRATPKILRKNIKKEPPASPPEIKEEKPPKAVKIKTEERHLSSDEVSTASDEVTLDVLRQQNSKEPTEIKQEPQEDIKKEIIKVKSPSPVKTKQVLVRKKRISNVKDSVKCKNEQRKKMKLFALWNGPKRHRVASLNAIAKVHCLYENEGRGNIIDNIQPIKKEIPDKKESIPKEKKEKKEVDKKEPVEKIEKPIIVEDSNIPARNLRTAPGLRGMGKHWDMHDTTSSSEDTGCESSTEIQDIKPKKEPAASTKKEEKKPPIKRRKRTEIIMDLKDMVVRKRMASLNASAILAASYSLEKNSSSRSPKSSSDSDSDDSDAYSDNSGKKKCDEDSKGDDKLIEVRATPNKKVAVILNQDTDVTITGVYVNSTTRSTHHEGYCSIAGMQYRISATSHTQTAATAVATETLLQSTSSSSQENVSFSRLYSCENCNELTKGILLLAASTLKHYLQSRCWKNICF